MLAKLNLKKNPPIVFFDGVCGLCSHFIDFVFKHDRSEFIQVAALQGETAKKQIPQLDASELSTVYLVDQDGKLHSESDAVLRVCAYLGFPWSLLAVLKLLPKALRDSCYGIVAKYRYSFFGKKDSCRMPTASELNRFLD